MATIMVVDDDPDTHCLMQSVLVSEGFACESVHSGGAALAAIDARRPDLILLDVDMPGLNGFDFCRAIKRDDRLRPIPVIFITGMATSNDVITGLQAGGIDYVTKPFVVDELIARIIAHLSSAAREQSTMRALDAAGAAIVALDADGEILWATPQARHILTPDDPARGGHRQTLRHVRSIAGEQVFALGDRRVTFEQVLNPAGPEHLFRVAIQNPDGEHDVWRKSFALTAREADVLGWLSRGKSNHDIATILNISSRTVDKHLQQIYAKMAVENRSAATALAIHAKRGGTASSR